MGGLGSCVIQPTVVATVIEVGQSAFSRLLLAGSDRRQWARLLSLQSLDYGANAKESVGRNP